MHSNDVLTAATRPLLFDRLDAYQMLTKFWIELAKIVVRCLSELSEFAKV